MDIRDWPLDKIMQLPDCCFGQRWPVITSHRLESNTTAQWISEQSLPDVGVIWEIVSYGAYSVGPDTYFQIGLGDHAPADGEEFQAFEQLFHGTYDSNIIPRQIFFGDRMGRRVTMKKLVEPQGRRFAYRVNNPHVTERLSISFWTIISSIPKEAPEWLISGQVKSL